MNIELRGETEFLKLSVEVLDASILNKNIIHPFCFASIKLKLVKLQTLDNLQSKFGLEETDSQNGS